MSDDLIARLQEAFKDKDVNLSYEKQNTSICATALGGFVPFNPLSPKHPMLSGPHGEVVVLEDIMMLFDWSGVVEPLTISVLPFNTEQRKRFSERYREVIDAQQRYYESFKRNQGMFHGASGIDCIFYPCMGAGFGSGVGQLIAQYILNKPDGLFGAPQIIGMSAGLIAGIAVTVKDIKERKKNKVTAAQEYLSALLGFIQEYAPQCSQIRIGEEQSDKHRMYAKARDMTCFGDYIHYQDNVAKPNDVSLRSNTRALRRFYERNKEGIEAIAIKHRGILQNEQPYEGHFPQFADAFAHDFLASPLAKKLARDDAIVSAAIKEFSLCSFALNLFLNHIERVVTIIPYFLALYTDVYRERIRTDH